jgi:hypothetical protein
MTWTAIALDRVVITSPVIQKDKTSRRLGGDTAILLLPSPCPLSVPQEPSPRTSRDASSRRLGFGSSLLLGDLRQPPCQLDKFGCPTIRCRTGRRELLFLVSMPGRRVFLVALSCRPFSRELVLIGLSCCGVLFLVSLPSSPFGRELVLVLPLISPPRHTLDGKVALKTRNIAFQLGRRLVRARPLGGQLGPFTGKLCRQPLDVDLQCGDVLAQGVQERTVGRLSGHGTYTVRLVGDLYAGLSVVPLRTVPAAANSLLSYGLWRNAEFIGGLFIGEPLSFVAGHVHANMPAMWLISY